MKPTLFLCTLVLAGSAFVSAQQPTSPVPPPGSTPPTFPSDNATRSAPDTPAPAPSTTEQQSSTSSTSQTGATDTTNANIEGCLAQASSGGAFTLADSSGNSYMLQGDTSKLAKHVGEQVRVSGSLTQSSTASATDSSSATASPSASASPTPDASSAASASKFFNVKSINTIAHTCAATQQK